MMPHLAQYDVIPLLTKQTIPLYVTQLVERSKISKPKDAKW